MYSDRNEQLLIQQLREGSQTALSTLFHLYAGQLFSFCMQYSKSAEEVEEIVDDTFMRIWQSRAMLQPKESLRPLLLVTARRLLINAYRSRIHSPEYAAYLELAEPFAISSSQASHKVEYDDFVRKLQRALAQLPPTQQKIITMSKLQGMSNKEIQEALNLSPQTVKNQMSLALKALHEKLGILSILFFF